MISTALRQLRRVVFLIVVTLLATATLRPRKMGGLFLIAVQGAQAAPPPRPLATVEAYYASLRFNPQVSTNVTLTVRVSGVPLASESDTGVLAQGMLTSLATSLVSLSPSTASNNNASTTLLPLGGGGGSLAIVPADIRGAPRHVAFSLNVTSAAAAVLLFGAASTSPATSATVVSTAATGRSLMQATLQSLPWCGTTCVVIEFAAAAPTSTTSSSSGVVALDASAYSTSTGRASNVVTATSVAYSTLLTLVLVVLLIGLILIVYQACQRKSHSNKDVIIHARPQLGCLDLGYAIVVFSLSALILVIALLVTSLTVADPQLLVTLHASSLCGSSPTAGAPVGIVTATASGLCEEAMVLDGTGVLRPTTFFVQARCEQPTEAQSSNAGAVVVIRAQVATTLARCRSGVFESLSSTGASPSPLAGAAVATEGASTVVVTAGSYLAQSSAAAASSCVGGQATSAFLVGTPASQSAVASGLSLSSSWSCIGADAAVVATINAMPVDAARQYVTTGAEMAAASLVETKFTNATVATKVTGMATAGAAINVTLRAVADVSSSFVASEVDAAGYVVFGGSNATQSTSRRPLTLLGVRGTTIDVGAWKEYTVAAQVRLGPTARGYVFAVMDAITISPANLSSTAAPLSTTRVPSSLLLAHALVAAQETPSKTTPFASAPYLAPLALFVDGPAKTLSVVIGAEGRLSTASWSVADKTDIFDNRPRHIAFRVPSLQQPERLQLAIEGTSRVGVPGWETCFSRNSGPPALTQAAANASYPNNVGALVIGLDLSDAAVHSLAFYGVSLADRELLTAASQPPNANVSTGWSMALAIGILVMAVLFLGKVIWDERQRYRNFVMQSATKAATRTTAAMAATAQKASAMVTETAVAQSSRGLLITAQVLRVLQSLGITFDGWRWPTIFVLNFSWLTFLPTLDLTELLGLPSLIIPLVKVLGAVIAATLGVTLLWRDRTYYHGFVVPSMRETLGIDDNDDDDKAKDDVHEEEGAGSKYPETGDPAAADPTAKDREPMVPAVAGGPTEPAKEPGENAAAAPTTATTTTATRANDTGDQLPPFAARPPIDPIPIASLYKPTTAAAESDPKKSGGGDKNANSAATTNTTVQVVPATDANSWQRRDAETEAVLEAIATIDGVRALQGTVAPDFQATLPLLCRQLTAKESSTVKLTSPSIQQCPIHHRTLILAGSMHEAAYDHYLKLGNMPPMHQCIHRDTKSYWMDRPQHCAVDQGYFACPTDYCTFAICKNCIDVGQVAKVKMTVNGKLYDLKRTDKASLIGLVIVLLLDTVYVPVVHSALELISCSRQLQCTFPRCYADATAPFVASVIVAWIVLLSFGVAFPVFLLVGLIERRAAVKTLVRQVATLEMSDNGEDIPGRFVVAPDVAERIWTTRILPLDKSLMRGMYDSYELPYLWFYPITLIFKLLLVVAVVVPDSNSLTQLTSTAAVEIVSMCLIVATNPFTDGWVDLVTKIGGLHQVLQLCLMGFYRIDANVALGVTMLSLAICYLVVVLGLSGFLVRKAMAAAKLQQRIQRARALGPFHAINAKDDENLDLLLEHAPDKFALRDPRGCTPLMKACELSDTARAEAIVVKLLDATANGGMLPARENTGQRRAALDICYQLGRTKLAGMVGDAMMEAMEDRWPKLLRNCFVASVHFSCGSGSMVAYERACATLASFTEKHDDLFRTAKKTREKTEKEGVVSKASEEQEGEKGGDDVTNAGAKDGGGLKKSDDGGGDDGGGNGEDAATAEAEEEAEESESEDENDDDENEYDDINYEDFRFVDDILPGSFQAAERGDVAMLKQCTHVKPPVGLPKPFDLVADKDKDYSSVVHRAAHGNQGALLRYLLGSSADGAQEGDAGEPEEADAGAPTAAPKKGKRTVDPRLSEVNHKGQTPLCVASTTGACDAIRELVLAGAKVMTNDYGEPGPVHRAISADQSEALKLLLESLDAAADVERALKQLSNGKTILHLVAENGSINCAKLLFQHNQWCAVVEALIDHRTKGDQLEETALQICVSTAQLVIARMLLERKADALKLSGKGLAATHMAAMKQRLAFLKLFHEFGVNLSTTTSMAHKRATPLILAAKKGAIDVMEFLVCEVGCSAEDADADYSTAISSTYGDTALNSALQRFIAERAKRDKAAAREKRAKAAAATREASPGTRATTRLPGQIGEEIPVAEGSPLSDSDSSMAVAPSASRANYRMEDVEEDEGGDANATAGDEYTEKGWLGYGQSYVARIFQPHLRGAFTDGSTVQSAAAARRFEVLRAVCEERSLGLLLHCVKEWGLIYFYHPDTNELSSGLALAWPAGWLVFRANAALIGEVHDCDRLSLEAILDDENLSGGSTYVDVSRLLVWAGKEFELVRQSGDPALRAIIGNHVISMEWTSMSSERLAEEFEIQFDGKLLAALKTENPTLICFVLDHGCSLWSSSDPENSSANDVSWAFDAANFKPKLLEPLWHHDLASFLPNLTNAEYDNIYRIVLEQADLRMLRYFIAKLEKYKPGDADETLARGFEGFFTANNWSTPEKIASTKACIDALLKWRPELNLDRDAILVSACNLGPEATNKAYELADLLTEDARDDAIVKQNNIQSKTTSPEQFDGFCATVRAAHDRRVTRGVASATNDDLPDVLKSDFVLQTAQSAMYNNNIALTCHILRIKFLDDVTALTETVTQTSSMASGGDGKHVEIFCAMVNMIFNAEVARRATTTMTRSKGDEHQQKPEQSSTEAATPAHTEEALLPELKTESTLRSLVPLTSGLMRHHVIVSCLRRTGFLTRSSLIDNLPAIFHVENKETFEYLVEPAEVDTSLFELPAEDQIETPSSAAEGDDDEEGSDSSDEPKNPMLKQQRGFDASIVAADGSNVFHHCLTTDGQLLAFVMEYSENLRAEKGIVIDKDKVDEKGTTPLMAACEHQHLDCVDKLLSWGANAKTRNEKGQTLAHLLMSQPVTLRLLFQLGLSSCDQDKDGLTPIQMLSGNDASDSGLKLLASRPDCNVDLWPHDLTTNDPPIVKVIRSRSYDPKHPIVKLATRFDYVDPNTGDTLFHIIASHDTEPGTTDLCDMIERLSESNAEGVKKKNAKGDTALWLALVHRRWDLADALLTKAPELATVTTLRGFPPLFATQECDTDVVKRLIELTPGGSHATVPSLPSIHGVYHGFTWAHGYCCSVGPPSEAFFAFGDNASMQRQRSTWGLTPLQVLAMFGGNDFDFANSDTLNGFSADSFFDACEFHPDAVYPPPEHLPEPVFPVDVDFKLLQRRTTLQMIAQLPPRRANLDTLLWAAVRRLSAAKDSDGKCDSRLFDLVTPDTALPEDGHHPVWQRNIGFNVAHLAALQGYHCEMIHLRAEQPRLVDQRVPSSGASVLHLLGLVHPWQSNYAALQDIEMDPHDQDHVGLTPMDYALLTGSNELLANYFNLFERVVVRGDTEEYDVHSKRLRAAVIPVAKYALMHLAAGTLLPEEHWTKSYFENVLATTPAAGGSGDPSLLHPPYAVKWWTTHHDTCVSTLLSYLEVKLLELTMTAADMAARPLVPKGTITVVPGDTVIHIAARQGNVAMLPPLVAIAGGDLSTVFDGPPNSQGDSPRALLEKYHPTLKVRFGEQ